MKRQWKGRTRGGPFGYLFFIWLVRTAGLGAAYAFLGLVVVYFIVAAPSQTRSVWVYSRRILRYGHLRSAGFLFRSYYAFGQSIIDKVVAGMGMADRFTYVFDGRDVIMEMVRSRKGCVVIGAHTGSWQMGASFFGKAGARVNVVMLDNEYRSVKDIVNRNVCQPDFKVIPLDDSDFSFLISITSALRDGELVCFQGDRYINEDRVMRTEFLGYQAEFPEGPFHLAASLGCPAVFYFAMREKGRRYRFIFRTPEMISPRNDGEKMNDYIFRTYISALEEVVREYPGQWFNYYDFWKLYSDK